MEGSQAGRGIPGKMAGADRARRAWLSWMSSGEDDTDLRMRFESSQIAGEEDTLRVTELSGLERVGSLPYFCIGPRLRAGMRGSGWRDKSTTLYEFSSETFLYAPSAPMPSRVSSASTGVASSKATKNSAELHPQRVRLVWALPPYSNSL